MIRLIVVDDHPATLNGILNEVAEIPDIHVVGSASQGIDALQLIRELVPDVVLLDCQLPLLSGAEIAQSITQEGISSRVLAMSGYDDNTHVFNMLSAGARGYLLKTESMEMLVEAIYAVSKGERWFSPSIKDLVISWSMGGAISFDGITELTTRELEVLRLLARGSNNAQIAEKLSITEGTTKQHICHIYAKLNISSRAELVAWAWENGVVA